MFSFVLCFLAFLHILFIGFLLYSPDAVGSSEDPVSSNEGATTSVLVLMLFKTPFWAPVQCHNPRVFATLGMIGFVRLGVY